MTQGRYRSVRPRPVFMEERPTCGIGRQSLREASFPAFVTAKSVARTSARRKWIRSELPNGLFSHSRSSIVLRAVLRDRGAGIERGRFLREGADLRRHS